MEEVSHSIRFPKDLHEKIKAWAEKEARSFNAHVLYILDREWTKYNYTQTLKKDFTADFTDKIQ